MCPPASPTSGNFTMRYRYEISKFLIYIIVKHLPHREIGAFALRGRPDVYSVVIIGL